MRLAVSSPSGLRSMPSQMRGAVVENIKRVIALAP
jgi:hypothetical protein